MIILYDHDYYFELLIWVIQYFKSTVINLFNFNYNDEYYLIILISLYLIIYFIYFIYSIIFICFKCLISYLIDLIDYFYLIDLIYV